jgi:hypothetical protein
MGIKRASADVGLMFIAYDFRRIGNILTRDRLMEYLRILVLLVFGKKDHSGLKKSLFRKSFLGIPVWEGNIAGSQVPA